METCFSSGGIAIVAGLLTALTGAIGILFKALLSSLQTQNKDLRDQNEYLQTRLDQTLGMAEGSVNLSQGLVRDRTRHP